MITLDLPPDAPSTPGVRCVAKVIPADVYGEDPADWPSPADFEEIRKIAGNLSEDQFRHAFPGAHEWYRRMWTADALHHEQKKQQAQETRQQRVQPRAELEVEIAQLRDAVAKLQRELGEERAARRRGDTYIEARVFGSTVETLNKAGIKIKNAPTGATRFPGLQDTFTEAVGEALGGVRREIEQQIKELAKFGVTGALIDHDGRLVLTAPDGSVRTAGVVVGRDGEPGAPGKAGLSCDSFQLEPEYDGKRTVRLRWTDAQGAEQMREWRVPLPLYRGIWQADVQYQAGDSVSRSGSCWIATADTTEPPGEGSAAWVMSVKRGRDSRAGKSAYDIAVEHGFQGTEREWLKSLVGPPGPRGRDLTHLDAPQIVGAIRDE